MKEMREIETETHRIMSQEEETFVFEFLCDLLCPLPERRRVEIEKEACERHDRYG